METIQRLYIDQRKDLYHQWNLFLKGAGLRPEDNIDYTCGVYDEGQLIATGSLYKNIIKCVVVDASYQGGNTFNKLISHLMDEISSRGFHQYYVYTKPSYTQSFAYLGYQELARVDDVLVFLERAVKGMEDYQKQLRQVARVGNKNTALVLNANPFTLGHQYLVELAAKNSDNVYVFVVAEDASVFPYEIRMELVKKGCAHLENVIVLSTNNYMVSSKTFPSYFIKEDNDITRIQARLDATLFKEKIAPTLGINQRYLGEEPLSNATRLYNEALKKTLEPEINVTIIPRKEMNDHPISASYVRENLKMGRLDDVKHLVPSTTFDFFLSERGQQWLEHFKGGS